MKKKLHTYESEEIEVTYDLNRCIHAAECVKGLRKVFDPEKRPWIQPDQASAESVANAVTRCPTGALHFEYKQDEAGEEPPTQNSISIIPDGPVYLRGDIEVRDHEGHVLLRDTRFALCRCGKSANKPACDNTHSETGFEAPAHFDRSSLDKSPDDGESGTLVVKVMENGPVLVEGRYQIFSETTQPVPSTKNIALCRCGGSSNKPFCDGTHKKIGFES